MRLRLSALFLLVLFLLNACSQTSVPQQPIDTTAARPDILAFSNSGVWYSHTKVQSAILAGRIGGTADKALVPLYFGRDGRFLNITELRGMRGFSKHSGSTTKAIAYLRSIGVTAVYFTDFATYRKVMNRHSGVLSAYARTTTASVKSLKMSGKTVRYFNPYTTTSPLRKTALSSTSTPAPECVVDTSDSSGELQPQQTGGACVAKCLADQTALSIGCMAAPPPWNFVCVIAAGIAGTICVAYC